MNLKDRQRYGNSKENDKLLKDNEQLRKLNEELRRSEQQTRRNAETEVWNCKKVYAKKMESIDKRECMVISREQKINTEVNEKVSQIVKQKEKRLEQKLKKMEAKHQGILLGAILYGVLITIFEAIKTEVICADVHEFVNTILAETVYADNLVSSLLVTCFIFLCVVGIGWVLKSKADKITISVTFGMVAILVFFANDVKKLTSINLVWLYLLIWSAYLLAREWIEMKEH